MDRDTDVTEIDGVGSGTADNLVDDGFETVGDVADADVDELSNVKGFGDVKAEETIEEAASMIDDGDETDESEGISLPDTDDVDEETFDVEIDLDYETFDVEIDLDYEIGYHVIHVVLEEATSQHQSNNFGLRDNTYSLSEKLMGALLESTDRFETTVSVTEQELNAFYRAVSSGSLDYNSRAGITSMYGDLNVLKEAINEKRTEARSN